MSKAFAPANISCIFKIYKHKNPRWTGSYGVGFTLNEGVIAEASRAKRNEIVFNSISIDLPTVSNLIEKLTKEKIRVKIKSKLPLGCGFGLSGACALAAAYSINNLLGLKKSNKDLAIMAHTSEVKNNTGLGDVVNQFYGGFCVKLKPSSHFAVNKIDLDNTAVYCRHFSKLSTKSVITNPEMKNKINDAADGSMNEIQQLLKNKKGMQFKDIIKISKKFSIESRLLNDKNTMETIINIEKNGGNASMIMLGNSVFSDKPFKGSSEFKISGKGACLI